MKLMTINNSGIITNVIEADENYPLSDNVKPYIKNKNIGDNYYSDLDLIQKQQLIIEQLESCIVELSQEIYE